MATTLQTTTQTVNRTDLVGIASVAWIRPMTIQFKVEETKPETILFPFFDGIPVDMHVNNGAQLKTDAAGSLSGTFKIPPLTFNTGEREFKLQERPVYERDSVAGSTFGSARAIFTTSAVKNTFQETQDTFVNNTFFREINIIAPEPPPPARGGGGGGGGRGDPLAQSFFTHGVSGGCFITSIEVYFDTKDNSLPITLQIRELVNGTPGENWASPFSSITLPPSAVNVPPSTASTKFTFDIPVYLPENRDWCFVLLANSNNYHVWTSKIGEKSRETGKTIFEQPFIGSLFKSENNVTWTAEQSEDIKFKINKAKFNKDVIGDVALTTSATPYIISGDKMTVTQGSPAVIVEFDYQHGLRVNDYVNIVARAGASYRGIPATSLTSTSNTDFLITEIIDDFRFKFNAKSSATSSGKLITKESVNAIIVESPGSGYPPNTTITFDDPPAGGTRAEAVLDMIYYHPYRPSSWWWGGPATVVPGSWVIVGVTITNPGSGYIEPPGYTLSHTSSNPLVLTIITDASFAVTTNNVAHGYRASLTTATIPDTKIASRLKYTDSNYNIGSYIPVELNQFHETKKHSILISSKNRANYLPGQTPTELNLLLSTTNENTSPIISVREQRKLQTYAYVINNYPSYDEVIMNDGIYYIQIINGGTGYTQGSLNSVEGQVTFAAPNEAGGKQAKGFINVNGSGTITSITITENGSGYTSPASAVVTVSGGSNAVLRAYAFPEKLNQAEPNTIYHKRTNSRDWLWNGTNWVEVTDSEFRPTGGGALSKYMTKQISLETISKGARIFVNAASMLESSFDVYFRTSLSSSGVDHSTLRWTKMNCDVSRNLSKRDDEFLDYTFYLDDIVPFDVYDIKIVFLSSNKAIVPRLSNYRVIVLAT